MMLPLEPKLCQQSFLSGALFVKFVTFGQLSIYPYRAEIICGLLNIVLPADSAGRYRGRDV
jgi:hypothetical protein